MERNTRRKLQGVVTADKMDKTITVLVTTHTKHALYLKKVMHTKKYIVHDEKNIAHLGDTVIIMETRPLSAQKHFTLVEIVKTAEKVA